MGLFFEVSAIYIGDIWICIYAGQFQEQKVAIMWVFDSNRSGL